MDNVVSRHGIINKIVTVFLFAGYTTYIIPLAIKNQIQIGFFGNSVVFGSLMIVAVGVSKALARSEDRKYILLAVVGFILPILYFISIGLGAPA